MPWLIVLDPEFWWGVLVAAWALYKYEILFGCLLFIAFGLLITFWLGYCWVKKVRIP